MREKNQAQNRDASENRFSQAVALLQVCWSLRGGESPYAFQ